eukprot:CAMPEP_0119496826 /NCGR_PEP_ID=MMETSP1344-20130328/20051_1 /TAXON_ID=236787 /ORGANISM="Florenciella parvula, Strain CCMP2471" /LENGTH=32 /DNA_ID= /DNA_START= /DNA_END= /DNA_ORIENTATION=
MEDSAGLSNPDANGVNEIELNNIGESGSALRS